jgi:hypothetical protein
MRWMGRDSLGMTLGAITDSIVDILFLQSCGFVWVVQLCAKNIVTAEERVPGEALTVVKLRGS